MEWVTDSVEYTNDLGNQAMLEIREVQEMWALPIRRSKVVRIDFGSDNWISFPDCATAEDYMNSQGWFKKFN